MHDSLIEVARAQGGVVSVYLFGSFAEGRQHAESDVDLGVLLDWDAYPSDRDRFDCRLLLGTRFSDAARRAADVVILNDAPPQLRRAIVSRGRNIYCSDEARDLAFVTDARSLTVEIERTFRERLAQLHRHLEHLRTLRPRVTGAETLERDLSLHNDVLYSLLTAWQLVIDIAGELSAKSGRRFETYSEAIRNLAADDRFPAEMVASLEKMPGFRNVLVHEYVSLDMRRVIDAFDQLDPVEQFADVVAAIERDR